MNILSIQLLKIDFWVNELCNQNEDAKCWLSFRSRDVARYQEHYHIRYLFFVKIIYACTKFSIFWLWQNVNVNGRSLSLLSSEYKIKSCSKRTLFFLLFSIQIPLRTRLCGLMWIKWNDSILLFNFLKWCEISQGFCVKAHDL